MKTVREYRLKYLFGAWVTHARIFAESDEEAIFDAEAEFNKSGLPGWRYGVALFCGNRRVKTFKEAEG